MKKILFALLLSGTSLHAFDTVEFLGSSRPEDQGWTQRGTVTAEIFENALVIDDQSPESGAFFIRSVDKWIAESARAEGFALEIEAMVTAQSGPGSHRVEFSFDPYRIVLVLRSEKNQQVFQAFSEGEQPVSRGQESSDFVTWKVVWVPTGETPTFNIYANGELVKAGLRPLRGNSNQLNFGALADILKERMGTVHYKRITLRPLKEGETAK